MQLTSDRMDVVEGERVRAVLLVNVPQAVVLASGGVDHVKHAIEDIGFRDVEIALAAPFGWTRGRGVDKPIGLDWLVWIAGTPLRSASLSRDLTDELSVLDAWAASDDGAGEGSPIAHPYAVVCARCARVFGVVRVYGVAYPILEKEALC